MAFCPARLFGALTVVEGPSQKKVEASSDSDLAMQGGQRGGGRPVLTVPAVWVLPVPPRLDSPCQAKAAGEERCLSPSPR